MAQAALPSFFQDVIMLQIKNLTKIYDGGVKALDNVSFEVPDGEFLAVIA